MKTTDHFKRTIQMYLEQRAAEDALFAKNYRNPAKNIDDCVTYILNYVQKSGCNGFTDGEIFGVGGQGILSIATIIGEAALHLGLN